MTLAHNLRKLVGMARNSPVFDLQAKLQTWILQFSANSQNVNFNFAERTFIPLF